MNCIECYKLEIIYYSEELKKYYYAIYGNRIKTYLIDTGFDDLENIFERYIKMSEIKDVKISEGLKKDYKHLQDVKDTKDIIINEADKNKVHVEIDEKNKKAIIKENLYG